MNPKSFPATHLRLLPEHGGKRNFLRKKMIERAVFSRNSALKEESSIAPLPMTLLPRPSSSESTVFLRPGPLAPLEQVVILKGDRLSALALREVVADVLPLVKIEMVTAISDAARLLQSGPRSLLVTGVNPALEGDVVELIFTIAGLLCPPLVLAIVSQEEDWLLGALDKLAVPGLFDSLQEDSPRLKLALHAVTAGEKYWSPLTLYRLTCLKMSPDSLINRLTLTELVVLALAGGGCDDTEAATALDVQPTTVASVRRSLHRKLGVQHRGELIRTAAQHGFVQFTAAGIVRPGFGLLRAEYQAMKRRDDLSTKPAVSGPAVKLTPFSRSEIDPAVGFSMVPRHPDAGWRADARNSA